MFSSSVKVNQKSIFPYIKLDHSIQMFSNGTKYCDPEGEEISKIF
jgi:hypothetical protein